MWLALALASGFSAQVPGGRAGRAPGLPFVARNKCPFEGCVYREWTVRKEIRVYDTWRKARHEMGTLLAGEKVSALGGVVVTYRPGVIGLVRDMPDAGMKRGDSILTYTYLGEGDSQAWIP